MSYVNPASRATAAHRSAARARANAYPLGELPKHIELAIRAAVSKPTPPPKWVHFIHCSMPSRAWYEWHWARGINPELKRERLPAGVKDEVIARDGYVCQLCGGDVDPLDMHLDHIKPWSKGGPSTVSNLQVAHALCNMKKGANV